MAVNSLFNINEAGNIMALESGPDKVREICEMIRAETLQPAKEQAARIIADAHAQADEIISRANKDAEELMKTLKKDLEKEKSVSQATIELAVKQSVATLKQHLTTVFTDEMTEMTKQELQKTEVLCNIVNVVLGAVQEHGIDTNIQVALAKGVNKQEVVNALIARVHNKLLHNQIEIGDFQAGVVIKLVNRKVALEVTEKAVVELLSAYLSEDLRKALFRIA